MLRQRLENRQIRPEFRFVGIDLPADAERELKQIAEATGGVVTVAHALEDVESALEQILEIEPVDKDVNLIFGEFNRLLDELAEAIERVAAGDYSGAEARLAALANVDERSSAPFRDLARRRARESFELLFDVARELRVLQGKMVETVGLLLAAHRTDNPEDYDRAVDSYNELTNRYGVAVDEANRIRREMRTEL